MQTLYRRMEIQNLNDLMKKIRLRAMLFCPKSYEQDL